MVDRLQFNGYVVAYELCLTLHEYADYYGKVDQEAPPSDEEFEPRAGEADDITPRDWHNILFSRFKNEQTTLVESR